MAMDAELKAMHTVQKSLDGLDEATRARVLEWIGKKYVVAAILGTEITDVIPWDGKTQVKR